jgi:hypothetical protein
MAPTKAFPYLKTLENWLHIDYNPLVGCTSDFGYNPSPLFEELSVKNRLEWQNAYFQGIIALEDCPEEVGGFLCVPGFQNYCKEWTIANENYCYES